MPEFAVRIGRETSRSDVCIEEGALLHDREVAWIIYCESEHNVIKKRDPSAHGLGYVDIRSVSY